MSTAQIDFDGFWKEALETYFQEFIEFFFTDAHTDIDWSRPVEFLDKELQQVTPASEVGAQRVDKLVKVWLNDGEEAWVLAHIEVQSQHDSDFAKRVYTYNHRLFGRFDRRVATFAILGDEGSRWKPSQYGYELWGTVVDFKFSVVKLQEYREQWMELEASSNPFATVVMAHLKAQDTRRDADERSRWKWTLTRMLYDKGYARDDIQNLYKFIDWVMQLPKSLEDSYWQQVQSYEEEQNMGYVTYAERRGIEQGLEQGLEQAATAFRQTLTDILISNHSLASEQLETIKENLEKISDLTWLQDLSSLALKENTLAKFHSELEKMVNAVIEPEKEESVDANLLSEQVDARTEELDIDKSDPLDAHSQESSGQP